MELYFFFDEIRLRDEMISSETARMNVQSFPVVGHVLSLSEPRVRSHRSGGPREGVILQLCDQCDSGISGSRGSVLLLFVAVLSGLEESDTLEQLSHAVPTTAVASASSSSPLSLSPFCLRVPSGVSVRSLLHPPRPPHLHPLLLDLLLLLVLLCRLVQLPESHPRDLLLRLCLPHLQPPALRLRDLAPCSLGAL